METKTDAQARRELGWISFSPRFASWRIAVAERLRAAGHTVHTPDL